jgi:glycosyltransferase involved in cell wall biosynthesis
VTASVLHLLPVFGHGGGGRAALTAATAASEHADAEARIASLRPSDPWMLESAAAVGIEVLDAPSSDRLMEEMEAADLIQLHFWNMPELQELLEHDLPAIRLLVWSHVSGRTSPQLLPSELVAGADLIVATSALNARATATALGVAGDPDLPLIPAVGGWEGISPASPSTHNGFVVGYLGTVGFSKMAPEFAELCAGIPMSDARFVVCGTGDATRYLPGQVAKLGLIERFEFQGHVREVGPVLDGFDVFGYPLRPDSSGSSDLVVKEAMYAGVPPVVFPYAGVDELVDHAQTGLIARDAAEYARCIESLHDDPAERERLGANAHEHAERRWSPEVVGPMWRAVLDRALEAPKRERPAMIAAPSGETEGAARFVRSIGPEAAAFRASMEHADESPADADFEITRCTPPVGLGGGGLLDYGRRYPEDRLLALWSGLYMAGNGRGALAAGLLSKAEALGCPSERVAPHLEELMVS